MNMIHVNILRLMALACFFAPVAMQLHAQDAPVEPASAVELVEAQAILDGLISQEDSGSADVELNGEIDSGAAVVNLQPVPSENEVLISGDRLAGPEVAANSTVAVSNEEVLSLIDDATGIGDFNYDVIVGDTGKWDAENFFEPMLTEPTANALVKNASDTPDIYWALKDYLTKEEFPLTADEKDAILAAYFIRKGELIFVSNADRYEAYENAKRDVGTQGLPYQRYELDLPISYNPIHKLALAEIEAAAFVLKYGKDMERGIVAPNSLGSQFDLEPEGRSERVLLEDFASSKNPDEFFMALEPNDPDYATLKAELAKYEELYRLADEANIPQVPDAATLKIGSKGEAVAILRKRLEVLGYKAEYLEPVADTDTAQDEVLLSIIDELVDEGPLELVALSGDAVVNETDIPSTVQAQPIALPTMVEDEFDAELAEAVRAYQVRAGLLADGIAGPQTLKMINSGPRAQMAPLLIAMERHRWGAEDRGGRQIYVNLANYMAEVRDDNAKTFETRVVIGKNHPEYKTPEFHDEMEYLVINPEWNVPHSIGTKEMLPKLQRGGSLGSTMKMLNHKGQKVNMSKVNFNKYTARTFPYRFVQESGPSNALGKVKFIFPNKHNIYLHDTPAKSLFSQSYRAYSHGCVRVRDPIDLATHLMTPYFENPRASFDQIRATKKQRFVEMTTRIPVFITYFTTFVDDAGIVRRVKDVYGRDRLVQNALAEQGVVF